LLAACDTDSDSPTSTPQPTESATPTSAATEEAQPTPTEEVTEAAATEVIIPANTENYFLAISAVIDADSAPEDTPPAPEGSQWIIVMASLGSQAGETVQVFAEDLTLIDSDGSLYMPEVADSATEPPLVGTTVEAGTSLRGLVRFAIPAEATPAFLQWCPGGDCDQRLQTTFP
jgi:hypothetical protein